MHPLVLILLLFMLAALFFGLVPGTGAFVVRARWRTFRGRLLEASTFPSVAYADEVRRSDGLLGEYRFIGTLEAIQGKDLIWLSDGHLSVAALLEGVSIYILPRYSFHSAGSPYEKLEDMMPDEQPQSLSWSRISSLPAGTQVFVAGTLFEEDGRRIFRQFARSSLLVVIYDGETETILPRAIWGGRQKNEYWNQSTLISLITGSFSLLLVSYVLLNDPAFGLPALFALTFSCFPVAPLLPPGFPLYFLYRGLWRRARFLRAERDLFGLPLRYFGGDSTESSWQHVVKDAVTLQSGEQYVMVHGRLENRGGWRVVSDGGSVAIEGELRIRGGTMPPESFQRDYYLFGAARSAKDGMVLFTPEDPMAELIAIPGHPSRLAADCSRRARRLETIAAFFILGDLMMNLFLILLVLRYLMR